MNNRYVDVFQETLKAKAKALLENAEEPSNEDAGPKKKKRKRGEDADGSDDGEDDSGNEDDELLPPGSLVKYFSSLKQPKQFCCVDSFRYGKEGRVRRRR